MEEMNAIKMLLDEHVTIMRMIGLLENLAKNIKKFEKTNLDFYKTVVDFFKTYADRCHHGKEEKIFFNKLKSKPLNENEKKILYELIEEHKAARKFVSEIDKLKESKDFIKLSEVINNLVNLYKMHINKENTMFFYPTFKYFSEDEKKALLNEFMEEDRKVINEKYQKIVFQLSDYLKN
ncbi:MAG: hemerythrin domain-containing protein [Parachlamydiales bacterium]|jgi:hemerythrin-like domain-containing protein